MINYTFKRNKFKLSSLITHIFLIGLILAFIFPVFVMFSGSLKDNSEVITWPPTWLPKIFHWNNFCDVWSGDYKLSSGFKNSLIISTSTMLLCILFGTLASYAVARFKFKGKRTFLFLILATQMFSPVVLIIPFYNIFKSLSLLNTYISLIIPNVAFCLPMCIWLLSSYFKSISKDLDEAAMIDGCSRLGAIFKIIIPISMPGIISVGLFCFIVTWNDLLFPMQFITKDNLRPLTLMLMDFRTNFQTYWNKTMAASVIASLPIIILFIMIQKYLVKGLASGSVKE